MFSVVETNKHFGLYVSSDKKFKTTNLILYNLNVTEGKSFYDATVETKSEKVIILPLFTHSIVIPNL